MIRPPPRLTRTYTPFPSTPLFRRLPLAATAGAITAFSTSPLPHTGQLTSLRRRWSSQSSVEPNHASKTCADEPRISKTIICLAPEPKPVGGGGWPKRGRVHPQPAPCRSHTSRRRRQEER